MSILNVACKNFYGFHFFFFYVSFFSRYRFNQIPMKLFFITGEIEYFGFEIRGKISSIAFTCMRVYVCVYMCVYTDFGYRETTILWVLKKKKKKKLKDRAFVSFDDKSWSVLEELIIEIFISSSSFPDTIERPANQALGWSTYRHNEYANRPAFGYICFNELRSGSFAEERS